MNPASTEIDLNTSGGASPPAGFRDRLYERYLSSFKGVVDAQAVHAAADRQGRVYSHLLGPAFAKIQPNRVLDIGCGGGGFLYWAKSQGASSVEGCDVSIEQVKRAATLGIRVSHEPFQTFLTRFEGACDCITAFDLMEHLSRDEAFSLVELIYRALRPGGVFYLTTPNGFGWRPAPIWHGDLTHETLFSPETIRTVLNIAGFTAVQVSEIAPLPLSVKGRIRLGLWKIMRLWPIFIDLVETGAVKSRVLSRNMAVLCQKPTAEQLEAAAETSLATSQASVSHNS